MIIKITAFTCLNHLFTFFPKWLYIGKFAWIRLQMSSMLIQPFTYLDYRARLNIENEIRLTRYIKLTELRVDKKQRRIKENCHFGTRRRKT